MPRSSHWTFVTNHAIVLLQVSKHPDLTVREIAERVGITERAVHRILTDLSRSEYVTRTRVGRRSHYSVSTRQPMRHPTLQNIAVAKLLAALEPDSTS
jgi:DNA-binding MarR family transcriptional regulator